MKHCKGTYQPPDYPKLRCEGELGHDGMCYNKTEAVPHFWRAPLLSQCFDTFRLPFSEGYLFCSKGAGHTGWHTQGELEWKNSGTYQKATSNGSQVYPNNPEDIGLAIGMKTKCYYGKCGHDVEDGPEIDRIKGLFDMGYGFAYIERSLYWLKYDLDCSRNKRV